MQLLEDFSADIDLWLNVLLVRSVTEQTLNIKIGDDPQWRDDFVEYYPVWTLKPVTRAKTVKRIELRLRGSESFSSVPETQLIDHGLFDFDELLGIMKKAPAVRMNGAKYYLKYSSYQPCVHLSVAK